MKAYALVQGPRRKVLFVSESRSFLLMWGAGLFEPEATFSPITTRRQAEERAICKANDARIVPIDFEFALPKRAKVRGKQLEIDL